MINIKPEISKDGKTATFTVDLTQRHGPSSSGKTIIIASTQGNQLLGPGAAGISYGLTVYEKAVIDKATPVKGKKAATADEE